MRIDSSVIGMESVRSYKTSAKTTHRFMIMDYRENPMRENASGANVTGGAMDESTDIADRAPASEETDRSWQDYFGVSSGRLSLRQEDQSIAENLREVTLRYIFELLFAGRRNRLQEWMEEKGWTTGGQNMSPAGTGLQGLPMKQVSLSLVQETHYYEKESTFFTTDGTVRTKDGREIDFKVNVGMSRSVEETFYGRLDLAVLETIDPLVINLDTDVATVRDQTFFFDLDSDGTEEEIAMLNSGSGYLALDKNGDGRINNGTELFGTATGDGFRELAAYDEDGDGWIDEDDSIWSKLQIWCKDGNGNDRLYRLADKGVGAICLNHVGTEFSQKDDSGKLQAIIRSSGVFLYENGSVGTVQHLDLAT